MLVHCFSGCSQQDVIDALRARCLWPAKDGKTPLLHPQQHRRQEGQEPAKKPRVFDRLLDPAGTLAERYLLSRGLSLPAAVGCPPGPLYRAVTYNSAVWHPRACVEQPAAVFVAWGGHSCQSVYLDSKGRKSGVQPAKITWGSMGDECVRFGVPDEWLGLAEGPETALSASALYSFPVWATLGVERYAKVAIPVWVSNIVFFLDNDKAGAKAWSAVNRGLEVHVRKGRKVECVLPPPEYKDFNDMLTGRKTDVSASISVESIDGEDSISV